MKNMKKFDLDDLENVTGGVIVETDNRDRRGKYAIVDDNTGETRFSMNNLNDANRAAIANYHTSDEVISQEAYEKRFNRPLY